MIIVLIAHYRNNESIDNQPVYICSAELLQPRHPAT